jgi:hypothetical protein
LTEHLNLPETSESNQLSSTDKDQKLPLTSKPLDYHQYLSADNHLKTLTSNIREVEGNLFNTESHIPLAHCVSADFHMKRGIALTMRRKFGHVAQLREQKKMVTEIASLEVENRTILYLITKEHYWQKPTYFDLFQTLLNLKEHCLNNNITQLACPRLGCALDGLQWETVRSMLCYIFRKSTITITVIARDQLTEKERLRIVTEFHENPLGGHQGINRTYQRISKQYYWKGMRQTIKKYVLSCPICQLSKSATKTTKKPMVVTTTASRPFDMIFMDIVDPLPKFHDGNVYILTLQDDLSKFAWAVPMVSHEANTAAHHFVTQFLYAYTDFHKH